MKKLGRDLGALGVISISIGAMLGSGIFVLPGLAAAKTGPSLWLAYVVAAFLVVPAALSKSELSTAMPASGGTYLYIERSLGPAMGTVLGVGAWMSLMFKAAFALIGLGEYLNVLRPVPIRPAALALLALIVALNMFGVKKVGKVQTLLVALCLVSLGIIATVGVETARPDLLEPHFPEGLRGVLAAAGFVFVSYGGVTKVAAVAEEVANPGRNLPLGILVSLLVMGVVYAGISFVLLANIPAVDLHHDATPIATLARHLFGGTGALIMSVVAVLALVSMANAGVLAASRFPFAMSRDRLLPDRLGQVNDRWLTPHYAILATGVVMAASIALLDIEKIAKLASAFMIFLFIMVNLALIVFRESGARWYRPSFRSPLYPLTQIGGILGGLLLLAMMGPLAVVGVSAFAVLSAAWYALYARRRIDRRGLWQQIGPRTDILGEQALAPEAPIPEADVLVALFGRERSPEALVEIAAALRGVPDDRVDVLYLREVPEQTELRIGEMAAARVQSVRRRVEALAESIGLEVYFELVVNRDLRRTLYRQAAALHANWVILEHNPRQLKHVFIRSPLEWLLHNLPANLAVFQDAGVRVYREILVVAAPGPHDALVARTADELAQLHEGNLTFLDVLPPNASPIQVQGTVDYHEQIRGLCTRPTRSRILREADAEEAIVTETAAYDLLVMAAPEERPWRNMFLGSREQRIARAAHCSVLQLRTPRSRIHQAAETLDGGDKDLDLMDYLDARTTRLGLDVHTKENLFAEIAAVFGERCTLPVEQLESAFWERERTQNTAIGQGVAIPHATIPAARTTFLGLFTLARGIEYGDGQQAVSLCIATVGPPSDRQTHLLLLAAIARLIVKTDLVDRLAAAVRVEDVFDIIRRAQDALDPARRAS